MRGPIGKTGSDLRLFCSEFGAMGQGAVARSKPRPAQLHRFFQGRSSSEDGKRRPNTFLFF